MHRVLASHLATFQRQYAPDLPTEKAFEAFVAYCVARHHTSDSFDPTDQIYDGDDPGIDSVLFVADDVLVSSSEELMNLFEARRRDVDVHVIFTPGQNYRKLEQARYQYLCCRCLGFRLREASLPVERFHG
ncbi:MAG TPA: hypothetical protein VE592_06520 [Geminicoccaceae bacterium]|jgi:hypothetical protein|nr:hypothetical protein [Geminicoccaceae bacterium]